MALVMVLEAGPPELAQPISVLSSPAPKPYPSGGLAPIPW